MNHTELCECALSAGYEYQINKAQVQCEDSITADSDFVTYFAYNHAIIDVLNASFHVDLPAQLQDSLDKLTEDIPQYNLPDLQWFQTIENEMPNVYDSGMAVVQVDLIDMMQDVTTDNKECMYHSNEEFLMAQQKVKNYMRDAEWWQRMQFVSAKLGMLCWVSIFVICCRYKKTIIATILALQQLDEWQIVKMVPIKAEAGPTLKPDVQPILTLFPPHETNGKDVPMSPQHIMSLAFILIVIIASLVALAFAIWKKCRFTSSTLRTCFPVYPLSSYHRGICRADIFEEITNVANCKTMWAHFK